MIKYKSLVKFKNKEFFGNELFEVLDYNYINIPHPDADRNIRMLKLKSVNGGINGNEIQVSELDVELNG